MYYAEPPPKKIATVTVLLQPQIIIKSTFQYGSSVTVCCNVSSTSNGSEPEEYIFAVPIIARLLTVHTASQTVANYFLGGFHIHTKSAVTAELIPEP